MSTHYNAFISYRHSQVDSQIAAEIQRRLEHFAVPRSIQKKTGKKKIDRIFRDKEELPITSDLNDDITEALANSDYLIVICSPRTGESVWVEREIETFLKTHSRREVLTVLAEGEPADTIPEILRYDETTDPITKQVVHTAIEPLSCDWRVPARQARREELPRLAAALLGCTYDELRQRQRQYRLRRLTAGLTAALVVSLGLSAYFVRTGMLIRENYLQSLRNESRYLAAAAAEQLEGGDRITAILLALAALPDENNDRPVVTQAEYALGQAVNAYLTDSDSPVATGAFAPDGEPVDFQADEYGDLLCILDDMDLITLWDTDTVQRTHTIDPEMDVQGMTLAGDHHLAVWDDESIVCYDRSTGALLWSYDEMAYLYSVCLTPDASHLVVAGYLGELPSTETCVFLLDVTSGRVEQRFTVPATPAGDTAPYVTEREEAVFSQDGTKMLLPVYSDSRYYICLLDLEQGSGYYLSPSFYYLSDFCFAANGDVIAAGTPEYVVASYSYFDYTNLVESPAVVTGISGATGEVLWSSELTYYQVNVETHLNLCPSGTEVLCTMANVCQRMDCATGEVLGRCETTAPILDVAMRENTALYILQDGTLAVYYFEENRVGGRPYLTDNLRQAERLYGSDGYSRFFVLPAHSTQVLMYRYGVVDDSWQDFDAEVSFLSVRQAARSEEYLALLDEADQLYLYDLEQRRLASTADLGESAKLVTYDVLGFSDDGQRLFLLQEESYPDPAALLTVDAITGAVERADLPVELDESTYSQAGGVCVWEDQLVYTLRDWGGGAVLAIFDPGSNTSEFRPLWEDSVVPSQLYHSGEQVLIAGEDGRAVMANLSTGTLTELAQPLTEMNYTLNQLAAWTPDGSLCAGVGDETLWIWDANGALKGEIEIENRQAVSLSFTPDGSQLLLLCSDGNLYRWSIDGPFLSKTEISAYLNASSSREVRWTFTQDGMLALWSDDMVLNLISMEDWALSAYAVNCLGYVPDQELLLCYRPAEDDGYRLCSYHRYSTQELVDRGRSIVGSTELSEEVKSEYGLS